MSITRPRSVLILGAGVSAPFGLSLGGSMIDEIRNILLEENKGPKDKVRGHILPTIKQGQSIRRFLRYPICGVIGYKHWDETAGEYDYDQLKIGLEAREKLIRLLDDQTSETIDDFIVENPTFAALTKICIAAIFMRSIYEYRDNKLLPDNFAARTMTLGNGDKERNWIHLLINVIRHGIRAGTVTKENKIEIVTFNYDKLLEFVLDKQFDNTELARDPWKDYMNIYHVHGECGDITEISSNPANKYLEWAHGIHVINEEYVPPKIRATREAVGTLISNADNLYFCGFSFAGPNCRMLGLNAPKPNKSRIIHYCNYDGNVGIKNAVDMYGRHHLQRVEEPASGTKQEPLGVTDWFLAGYPGELPG